MSRTTSIPMPFVVTAAALLLASGCTVPVIADAAGDGLDAVDEPVAMPACGYPVDPVFDRTCVTTADCSFGVIQAIPCRRAAVGYRTDDAARFDAYRTTCDAEAANFPGQDGDVCNRTFFEYLLTDDGANTFQAIDTRVSVACTGGVCSTRYQ